jgi:hypothetical protein
MSTLVTTLFAVRRFLWYIPEGFTYTRVVSSKFRTLFDSGRWLLLPETSIIDIYDGAIKKEQKFPIIDVRKY